MPIKFLNDVAVDTSVLYVDTINDKVGIGTAGPQAKLHIDAPTGDFLKISESGTDRLTLDSNNEMVLTSPSNWGGYFKVGKNVGPYEVAIELGEGRTANGLSRIDLVGDTTYADYGFRIIRNNGGANTTSQLVHRGTGNFELVSTDSGDIILNPNNGNVGIGTTSPAAKLHILKTIDASGSLENNLQLKVENTVEDRPSGIEFRSKRSASASDSAAIVYTTTSATTSTRQIHLIPEIGASGDLSNSSLIAKGGGQVKVGNSSYSTKALEISGTSLLLEPGSGQSFTFEHTRNANIYFEVNNQTVLTLDKDNGGSVGIGTTSPDTKLDVVGRAVIGTGNTLTNATNATVIGNSNNLTSDSIVDSNTNLVLGDYGAGRYANTVISDRTLRLGRVDDITATSSNTTGILNFNDSVEANSAFSNVGGFVGYFPPPTTTNNYYFFNAFSENVNGSVFQPGASPTASRINISMDPNLDNVGYKFDSNTSNGGGVYYTVSQNNASASSRGIVTFDCRHQNQNYEAPDGHSLFEITSGYGRTKFLIKQVNGSSNVGIGTTNPSRALEINTTGSNNYQFRIGTGTYYYDIGRNTSNGFLNFYGNQSNASGFVFETVNGERMRIEHDGNVGIGTTSPSQKLHVSGNARVTGAYYDSNNSPGTSNQVLVSTVTGTDWIDGSAIPGVPDGSGTAGKIVMWQDSDTLTDSVLSQTTPYIGTNTGIVNINGTLKQSETRKSIYIGENVGQSVNPTSASLDIYNIGIGDDVLKDFTFGVVGANPEDPGDNVGIGYQALTGLLTGTNNVAVGTETLKALTLGANNIALGKNSLLALTGNRADSIGNVALGFNTLSSMTTGTYNVAIGNTNFEAITSANSIVSIGNDIAKPFTGSASNLVMIGNKVLANTTATSVTDGILIGQNSGLATSGTVTNDILIGRSVFQNNDSGGNNIAIGGNANQNLSGTVSTSIALTTRNGSGTGGNASSYGIVISTYDSADVGVGSVNESTGKYSATIGGIGNLNQGGNGFIGGGKTNTIVSTATNSAILGGFDNDVQSGSGGMALGSNLQVNGNNQVVLGRFNTPNTNSKLIVGAGFSNANRINAFEVKNTSQLKLGKYGQTTANFPATSTLVNVLVVGAANNVTEIPLSAAAFNSQLSLPNTRTVTAGSTTNLSSAEEKIVKISWIGTTGNAILKLPLASNFTNKTIRFITDSSFPATATAQITGGSGTETINGSTAGVTLTGTYQATMVWSDGTEWWVL